MNTSKTASLIALLAAVLFSTQVHAQIKVKTFKKFREKNNSNPIILKTYAPEPLNINPDNALSFRCKLISELDMNIKKVDRMFLDYGSWEGLTALNDKIVSSTRTFFYYHDIVKDTIEITYEDKYENGRAMVYVGKLGAGSNYKYPEDMKFGFGFPARDVAQKFAENLFYIQQAIKVDQLMTANGYEKGLTEFKVAAKSYNDLVEKPVITEEQRKYIVQANLLNNEKKYCEALAYYEKAVEENATAYPAAYYNMALISAQLEGFRNAIFNIKKYLLLVPDAPDARAAKDKIYEWELKITEHNN